MLHNHLAPKGFLREDHLLLVGENLADLSSNDLKSLIADVLESVEAMNPKAVKAPPTLPAFLAKSLTETVRVLNSPSPASPYRRYSRVACD